MENAVKNFRELSGFLAAMCLIGLTSCSRSEDTQRVRPMSEAETNRDTIAREMQQVLDTEEARWYPLSLDTVNGGYFSDINARWELQGKQNKMIVTQARHVWSASNTAMFDGNKDFFLPIAAHGVKFLRDVMWDKEYGGFFELVDRTGEVAGQSGPPVKTAYGNAFAIYGLAAYYLASGDTAALGLAKKTFLWMEHHSHDPQYGGYFQYISREGVPFTESYNRIPPKDQNSMIHILEALTELSRAWPEALVRKRLGEMLSLIRDTVVTPEGYLTLFFRRDWTPVSYRDSSEESRERNFEFDHVSFGHDVETAYLMLEASHALGIKNDTLTLMVGKRMDDHALRNGWDTARGGIYDGGYYFAGQNRCTIVRRTKEWWSQVEALNSFLMMSTSFPRDTMNYYGKFCAQWNYCKNYLIDAEFGGWYWGGTDIVPDDRRLPKGTIWKADYHTSRGMINCIRRLEGKAPW